MTLERPVLKRIVEAALFAAGQPLSLEKLGELFYEEERPSLEEFRAVLAELETDYAERGVHLKEVASGYRFQASHEVGEWVSRLWEEKPQRYSRALLETLALIAYRQPITRGEVEDIRGVSVSSHIVKTLLEREWVRVLGYRDVPGRPAMYGTTKAFLDYFNLRSLEELPTLAEVRDLDKISAELDERLQQTQPQASLPLDAGQAAAAEPSNELNSAVEPSLSEVSEPEAKADEVTPDSNEAQSETIPEELVATESDADRQTPADAHTETSPTEHSVAADSLEKPTPAEAPQAQSATPSLFSSVLQRARSLFADPEPEPTATPSETLPAEPAEAEIPPSPIDPHDPRLN